MSNTPPDSELTDIVRRLLAVRPWCHAKLADQTSCARPATFGYRDDNNHVIAVYCDDHKNEVRQFGAWMSPVEHPLGSLIRRAEMALTSAGDCDTPRRLCHDEVWRLEHWVR